MPIFPYQKGEFKSLLININDSVDQEIKSKFELANHFIDSAIQKGQNVLVHWYIFN
jgi:protein-tyrosine phosphatase